MQPDMPGLPPQKETEEEERAQRDGEVREEGRAAEPREYEQRERNERGGRDVQGRAREILVLGMYGTSNTESPKVVLRSFTSSPRSEWSFTTARRTRSLGRGHGVPKCSARLRTATDVIAAGRWVSFAYGLLSEPSARPKAETLRAAWPTFSTRTRSGGTQSSAQRRGARERQIPTAAIAAGTAAKM